MEEERKYSIDKIERGIYYLNGDAIPIQIIVSSKLSYKDNLWLRCLSKDIKDTELVENLAEEYGKHKNMPLYDSVMDIIVRYNKKKFQEVKPMCEALSELWKDDIIAAENRVKKEANVEKQKLIQFILSKGISMDEIATATGVNY